MKLDLFSYLLGQKSVKIPTPPAQKELPLIRKVGFYGDGQGTAATSIQVLCPASLYSLISIMHRDDLTAPEDCELLDKSTYTTGQSTQYVSVFKRYGAAAIKTFEQASSARISASVWGLGKDFNLEKVSNGSFNLFDGYDYNCPKDSFLYATVSSVGSTGSTTVLVDADSKDFWINAPSVLGINQTVLRHFSAIRFPYDEQYPVNIAEVKNSNDTFTTMGHCVIYKITKAE